ncbi:MAG: hypothetical protein OSB09_11790 [Planctomycetota bacterium]|nr:hypothetical protein [Planctomycetota bacterium]
MSENSAPDESEWVVLLQGGTAGIRSAAQVLDLAGVIPRVTAAPGG